MESEKNGLNALEARRIENEAVYLIKSICAVLEAIAEHDNDKSASVRDVIEAIDEVHELYDALCHVTAKHQVDGWNQAGAAGRLLRYDFGRRQEMTALDASFSAGRLIIDECAMHLPRGKNSSRADLENFAARVSESLKGVSLRTIEEQLPKEWAAVCGLQPNWAAEWELLNKNAQNVVRAAVRLHCQHTRQRDFSMHQIKVEAAKGGSKALTYVGTSNVEKLTTRLRLSGFLVKESKAFLVPIEAREWLLQFDAGCDAAIFSDQ